ncbi:uncharacterized protein LOC112568945 isoform X4 [Pomacea canaliculata]|uniref:uncharacterized protein LOC112568945 isoform X4 n=1 Tax=Pomacea canaliculata TaxID=400727 RepID=UPI000D727D31|nr:uncharacterized protein LOC112568945 isoform X4 [Pomacea canaliculata]
MHTSSSFSSCEIRDTDSRKSRVRTLVMNLSSGESLRFGCEVSSIRAGERVKVNSWFLTLTGASTFRVHPFFDEPTILEVTCSGEVLDADATLLTMALYRVDNSSHIIATVNPLKNECSTTDVFSACVISWPDSRRTQLKTLVQGVTHSTLIGYGCDVTSVRSGERAVTSAWRIDVRGVKTTTTTTQSTTTTSTTTLPPEPATPPPRASGVKSKLQEFQLPVSVIIIGLVLLIFFAALCVILIILQCRGRRRRRSRAANRESLLSARNEPVGGGGYRTTRSTTTFPAPGMPPDGSGGNLAMRYQKSIPDTGYVSGSSVYYSEPYGTLDDEMKERLRPNPRMCHIPYDIKGGPLDPHAQAPEHSA